MSCCDGALLYINNQTSGRTPPTINVISVTPDQSTTITGIAGGDTILPNSSIQGTVQSAKGSNGAAEGQIVISVDTQTFTLNYSYKPRNEFGHCPCTSKGSSSPQSGNGYKVNVKNTSGENSGCVLNFYVENTTV
ncbi:MAG: hypothetical protein ACLGH0_07165 [Thermoanaerobaculia bacterium]